MIQLSVDGVIAAHQRPTNEQTRENNAQNWRVNLRLARIARINLVVGASHH